MTRRATVSLELDELRLIAAAKAGDKPAYEQLLRRHQVAVFHAAYLRIGSAAQAQTVTMQAFVQGWEALRRKPATVPFAEWVLSLACPGAQAHSARRHRSSGRAGPVRMRSSPRSMTVPAAVAARGSPALPR